MTEEIKQNNTTPEIWEKAELQTNLSMSIQKIKGRYNKTNGDNPEKAKEIISRQIQEVVQLALSKKNAILDIYEEISISDDKNVRELTKNPAFIKNLNEILSEQYPYFFGVAKNAVWYNDRVDSFAKIVTLLDIIKYRPLERQKDFIEMMNGLESGTDTDKALKIYENYFMGTEIGNQIFFFFWKSKIKERSEENLTKILHHHKDKHEGREGSIYDILAKKGSDLSLSLDFFGVPEIHLNILLSLLPEIETLCFKKDTESVIRKIDSLNNSIDVIFIKKFFNALVGISKAGFQDTSANFYSQLWEIYCNKTDVSKETKELSKNEMNYSIINQAFPGLDIEKKKQKNMDLKKFLHDVIKDGKISVTRKNLLERLDIIFSDSKQDNILRDIKTSKDGHAIFELLSDAYAEQEKFQKKELQDEGFLDKKWGEFKKKNPENSRDILAKLNNPSTSVIEKENLLRDFIDPEKIPKDEQGRKEFIDKITQQISQLTQTAKSAQIFSNENFKDFSTSWQSGDFSTFNKKVQEREEKKEADEKKKQQETEKKTENSNVINTAVSVDFQSLSTDFIKRPDGQIISTFFGDNEVIIKKDSNNEISIYSGGIPIREIKVSNPENIKDDIKEAINSIQFLQKYGLNVFRDDIPTIVELINNRPRKDNNNKEIDLSNGIDPQEELWLLESIASLASIKIPEWSPNEKLSVLKTQFHILGQQNGRLTSLLRTKGYIQTGSNSIDKFALEEGIKNTA